VKRKRRKVRKGKNKEIREKKRGKSKR